MRTPPRPNPGACYASLSRVLEVADGLTEDRCRVRNPIVGRKLKYNGIEKRRFEGDLVDGAPAGWFAIFHEAATHKSWKEGELTHTSPYFIYLLNPDVPCVVSHYFDERGGPLEIQADASVPPVFEGRDVRFIDLDMDLIVQPTGNYFARDIEQFKLHVEEWHYPPEVIKQAWDGLMWARQCVEARIFPFDGTAAAILGRALAAQGPL